MINNGVFEAAVLENLAVTRFLIVFQVVGIDDRVDLVVVVGLDEGGDALGRDLEGGDFIAYLVQVLTCLVVAGVEGLAYVGEHPFVTEVEEKGVLLESRFVDVN